MGAYISKPKYHYLIVGCGLFGSVFGRIMSDYGRRVLLIDKRKHLGGNVCSDDFTGINVHLYGPHLFHTSSDKIWSFVNRYTEFNHYQHRVKANYKNKIYSLPFNLMTFHQFWGCVTPEEAEQELNKRKINIEHPKNMEEWAISQLGEEIYDVLIYGYTKKHWNRNPKELPASILRRLPIRFNYNENYYSDPYQGVPKNGYRLMMENMIDGLDIKLETNFFDIKNWKSIADKLVFSGPIDEFFNYKFGELEYRSLKFVHKEIEGDFQGIGQMNFTNENIPWTRIVEHKHFYFQNSPHSIITYEFPQEYQSGKERYYPVNDFVNNEKYSFYKEELKKHPDVIGGGRLFSYKYFDMDSVIGMAIHSAEKELGFCPV